MAVDDHVADIRQQLGGAVLALQQLEERGCFVDEPRRAVSRQELRVRHQIDEEGDVRLDAADAEFLQAAFHAPGRVHEAQAVGRHLHEERVVIGRDHGAAESGAGVQSNAQAAGRAVMAQPAIIGQEVVGWIFGRDPALERMSVDADIVLSAEPDFRVGKRLALGDQDLALDDVIACHLFGDRVFHLDARIDLDEVELTAVSVDEEFDRAGIVEAYGLADRQGRGQELVACCRLEVHRRCDLDDFLMTALQGAVALEKVDESAVLVAKELDLDVAGPRDVFLQEDVRRAERRAGFAACLVERFVELVRRRDDAHSPPAPAH